MAKAKESETPAGVHCCGDKKIMWGIILLAVGLAIENGWDFGQILMLVGGILLVKGVLVRTAMRG